MTQLDYLEPKNGDFIAYIDKLQQESIDTLKIANADRIAHAGEMGSSTLRDIASELMKRREASVESPSARPIPQKPQSQPRVPQQVTQKKPSVDEEFKNVPTRARRRKSSPGFAIGNFFLIIGIFLAIFGINAEIDELAGPGLFMMFIGFRVMKGMSRR